MPAGRPTEGPKHARKVDASPRAQQRLEVILATLSGEKSVADACDELGINEARFHVIRRQALQAAAERLEPRKTGRPPHEVSPSAQRIAELEEELERKAVELRAAEVRCELAIAMPHVLQSRAPGAPKKTRPRGTKIRARLGLSRGGRKKRKA